MKAVYIEEHGGLEALKYGDRPDPEVAPGEIMLRVRASALNRADLGLREGSYRGSLPRIMGMDIAGEVAQISPDAQTDLKVGDRVILDNRVKCNVCDPCQQGQDQYCTKQLRYGVDLDGGHAEYVTAPAINVSKIADHITWQEAAAIPLAGHTAWQCMISSGQADRPLPNNFGA